MEFGVVEKIVLEPNMDSQKNSRMVDITVYQHDDDSVESPNTHGIDCNPVKGSRIYHIELTPEFSIAVVIGDETEPSSELAEGERETYAVEGKKRVATIRQKADGIIVMTEGTEPVLKGESHKKWADVHTHLTAFGPTDKPTIPMPESNFNRDILV